MDKPLYSCTECSELFTRKSNLIRHKNEVHFQLPQKHYHQQHIHCDGLTNLPCITTKDITRIIPKISLEQSIKTIRFYTDLIVQPTEFFMMATPLIKDTLDILKQETTSMKVICTLCVIFTNGERNDESYFSVKAQPLSVFDLTKVIQSIELQIETYTERGSHWIILRTNFFQMITVNVLF
jgi:hypothetical protein